MWLRSTVVLLLTFAALAQTVAGSFHAAEHYRIVTAYFYAVGENRFVETRYVLRRQGDAWKLWSRVDRPLPH